MRWRTLGLTALLSALPAFTPFEGLLPVAVSGCEALFLRDSGARCVRAPEGGPPLVLWLDGSWREEELRLEVEGPLGGTFEQELDALGIRYVVEDDATSELVLRHASGAGFALEVVHTGGSPDLDARLDELDERGLLRCALGDPRGRLERMDAEFQLRRLELGSPEQREEQIDALVDARAEVHCSDWSRAIELHGALVGLGDGVAAARLLERLRHDPRDLSGRLQYDYYLGLLHEHNGDLERAQEVYGRLVDLGQRTVPASAGESSLARYYLESAMSVRANWLVRLGRDAEAHAVAEASLERLERGAGLWQELELNATWNDYLSREHRRSRRPNPVPRMRALLAGLTREELRAALQLNLAAALLQAGEVAEAQGALEQLAEAEFEPHQRHFASLLGARLDLARGQLARARLRLDEAEREARLRGDEEFLLGLLVEQARLEQLAGQPERALQRYEALEQLADRLALRLPIDGSRYSFTSALSRARAEHIGLLIEGEREREALCTVLAARARHARALIARPGREPKQARYFELIDSYRARGRELAELLDTRRWVAQRERAVLDAELDALRRERERLLSDAMALLEREPPPWDCAQTWRGAQDEALLTMFPGPEGAGWWFFLARGEQVWVRWQELAREEEPGAALVERALAAFEGEDADRLAQLTRLSVIPIGQLAAVDVHALPRFAHAAAPRVDYRVALGQGPEANSGTLDARVLAFDDNLPQVLVEADEVRERLRTRGWSLAEAWSPQEPGRPDLLHYAGHGYHRGLSGWDSALAEHSGISSRTLISAQRAPRVVVLGACEAGSSELEAIDGGMNIAFAFLLAGAELVIAPDEPVEDSLARAFARSLYDALPAHAVSGPEPWLEALATLHRQGQEFAAWRAWLR